MTPYLNTFITYLENLQRIVEKIDKHFKGDPSILQARLADNMFPLVTQMEIAIGFTLRSCCPLAGKEVISFASDEKSFNGIYAQINKTMDYLRSIELLDNSEKLVLEDMAGPAKVSLPAHQFILCFTLPNFFFHLGMVYSIARANGVILTKGDFDGLHQYPPGFSFE